MTLNGVTVTLINGRVEGRALIEWPVPGAESGGTGPARCGKQGKELFRWFWSFPRVVSRGSVEK